ncbi:unnamed protein product [Agarophyton chilense]|eukprot:gb/GEZJ01004214.1/.p1 GENE.gb/GEZJ01004214.1/~~gb/GEZJ01004214.1/.p1  ORF type:complete len:348 (-),score=42.86 gb/GEZJ01004214.1/:274-1317(-)
MFPYVVAFICSSLLAVQLYDLLSVLSDFDSFSTLLTSGPIQLQPSANSVLAVSSFIIISIFAIVLVSSASPPTRNSPHYCPISVTAPDDINAFYYFPTTIKTFSKPVVSPPAAQILSPPSNELQTSSLAPLAESFSEVTFTFGTNRPEVYLKMCEQEDMNTICHCPCNHTRSDLRKYPHINRLTSSFTPSTPSFNSDSVFEIDSDQMNSLSGAAATTENTLAPSYHAIDMTMLPDVPSLEEVVCAPAVQPTVQPTVPPFVPPTIESDVCSVHFPPLLEIQLDTPVTTRALATDGSVIPNDHAFLLGEVKQFIVAQFKLFELVVTFVAFMRTLVDHAVNQTNLRRVPN